MGFLKSLFGGKKEVKEAPRTAPPPPVRKYTQPKKQVRWQDSRAYLLLLSNFKKPLRSDKFSKHDYWQEVLGEPVDSAIRRFKDHHLLREANLTEKLPTYNDSDVSSIAGSLIYL